MNVTGSNDNSIISQGPFSVGKKGELLFEGKAPKEVKQVFFKSNQPLSNFRFAKHNYMQSLAQELNTLYRSSSNGTLDAKVAGKGFTAQVRVTVDKPEEISPRSNKENITKELLDRVKSVLSKKSKTLTPKEILPRNDGSYEVTFEAQMHPGREIRQSISADEFALLAKEWEKL